MSEKSGFFVSSNGDRKYTPDFLARYISRIITNGVFTNECAVTADGSGMTVTQATGGGDINGYLYENDAAKSFTVSNADGSLGRKDIIVLRYTAASREIKSYYVAGEFSATPTAPALTRNSSVWELKLAEISVPAGTTAITQGLITDCRLDETVCGVVTGAVTQLTSADFMAQLEGSFNEWFDEMKGQLTTDAAGQLQAEIDVINGYAQPSIKVLANAGDGLKCVRINQDAFTGDGSTTQFALAEIADSIAKVTVDGTETNAYTYDDVLGIVTMTTAPTSGAALVIRSECDTQTATTGAGGAYTFFVTARGNYAIENSTLSQRFMLSVTACEDYEVAAKYYRYGIKIAKSNSSPSARISYIHDAVGMTPAAVNLSTGEFNYGDWADVWFVRDNYPVMLTSDGAEDYKLDPNDYTKKLADGSASDVSNTAYGGNAMAVLPLVYLSITEDASYQYIVASNGPYDNSFHAYAHTRANGDVMEKKYLPLFEGSKVGTTLRSLKGQTPCNTTPGASAEIQWAQANGALWNIRSWAENNLISCLCAIISKSDDGQTAFGSGHTTGGSQASSLHTTGLLSNKGQFFGTSSTTTGMKVFHMEHFWGDRWDRLVGMVNDNGSVKVKPIPPYSLSDFSTYDLAGITPSGTSGGYISTSVASRLGRIPSVASGASNTYQCDGLWFNNSQVDIALAGGGCGSDLLCGPWYLDLGNVASDSDWGIGASPSCEMPS